MNYNLPLRLI